MTCPPTNNSSSIYTKELSAYDEVRLPHETISSHVLKQEELFTTLQAEFTCPICLDLLKDTAVTECLHRFCMECIKSAIYKGNRECPTCRKKLISKRNLRSDPNIDALIGTIWPDREQYEAIQQERAQQWKANVNMEALQCNIRQGMREQAKARRHFSGSSGAVLASVENLEATEGGRKRALGLDGKAAKQMLKQKRSMSDDDGNEDGENEHGQSELTSGEESDSSFSQSSDSSATESGEEDISAGEKASEVEELRLRTVTPSSLVDFLSEREHKGDVENSATVGGHPMEQMEASPPRNTGETGQTGENSPITQMDTIAPSEEAQLGRDSGMFSESPFSSPGASSARGQQLSSASPSNTFSSVSSSPASILSADCVLLSRMTPMDDAFKTYVKKSGALGFVTVLIKPAPEGWQKSGLATTLAIQTEKTFRVKLSHSANGGSKFAENNSILRLSVEELDAKLRLELNILGTALCPKFTYHIQTFSGQLMQLHSAESICTVLNLAKRASYLDYPTVFFSAVSK